MMNVENVIAYEKSLIANLLKNNDLLQKLALKPHMFYAIEHQEFIKFVQEKIEYHSMKYQMKHVVMNIS